MARTFSVEVLTPERVLFSSDQVVSLTVPAWEGSLGIMAFHAPLVAALRTGVITIKLANGDEERIATTGGFMEVADNRAVILCDIAELDHEIDVERARGLFRGRLTGSATFKTRTLTASEREGQRNGRWQG
jgi:F-type H+-transporting ATPase subunit epsilon